MTHTTLIPAGTFSVRPLRYAVRIQIVTAGVVWLSDPMTVTDARALRRSLGV